MTDHKGDAQVRAERRETGRDGTPPPDRAPADDEREAAGPRFSPAVPSDATGTDGRLERGVPPGHAHARLPTGAATRLAEEMRREAEQRARAAQPGVPSGPEPRREASVDAQEQLVRTAAATHAFLERLAEATGELAGLLERVRGAAEELTAELGALASDAPPARVPPAQSEPPEDPPSGPEPPDAEPPPTSNGFEGGSTRSPGPAPAAPDPPAARTRREDEEQRARLLAFNMALNGASRNETARYLTENVPLVDKTDLLNEIYRRTAPGATAHAPSEVIKEL